MKHWYAVHSKPRQEATAELNLQRQGFTTYLPRMRVRKLRRGSWVKAIEPLFPRYLFIQLDPAVDNTAPVRSTRGAVGLVRIGNELRPIPEDVITYLQQAQDGAGNLRLVDDWPHRAGDRVQILQGPFAGLTGVYQMQLAESRALLLIELLGRHNAVRVDLHAIAATA